MRHGRERLGTWVLPLLGVSAGLCGCRGDDPPEAQALVTGKLVTGPTVDPGGKPVIPPSGGDIEVVKRNDPINGLGIHVPDGAFGEARTFRITYAPIVSHDFGPDVNPISPLITISAGGGRARKPVRISVPVTVPAGHFAMGFLYDDQAGTLEGLPLVQFTPDRVAMLTMNFQHSAATGPVASIADQVQQRLIKLFVSSTPLSVLQSPTSTDFRPEVDGFPFRNYPTSPEPLGICSGQSTGAIWYYGEQKKKKKAPAAFTRFDNDGTRLTPAFWQDDTTGLRFATVLQRDHSNPTYIDAFQMIVQTVSPDQATLLAFANAIKLTGEPQFVAIVSGQTPVKHAMVVYAVEGNAMRIYDPNFAGKDAARTIQYNPATRKFDPFKTGSSAVSPEYMYDGIYYMGRTAMRDPTPVAARWQEVEKGSIGKGVFAEYTLEATDKTGKAVPLGETFMTAEMMLRVTVRTTGPELHLRVFDAKGAEVGIEDSRVWLEPGPQRLGFNVRTLLGSDLLWAGFQWVEITRPGTPPPAFDINGTWLIGKLWEVTLTVKGNVVTGTFPKMSNGRLEGTLRDGIFVQGLWAQDMAQTKCKTMQLGSFYWGSFLFRFWPDSNRVDAGIAPCTKDPASGFAVMGMKKP